MPITLSTARHQSTTVVSVSGDIDLDTAAQLEDGLRTAIADTRSDLVVDLTSTTFLDSTGLGVLVGISKQLDTSGRSLRLVCPRARLLKIFQISRLDTVWPIFLTVDEAMAA